MLKLTIQLLNSLVLISVFFCRTSIATNQTQTNSNTEPTKPKSLSLYFNDSEGGDTSKRRTKKFLALINRNGCPVKTIDVASTTTSQLPESEHDNYDIIYSSLLENTAESLGGLGFTKQLEIVVINDAIVASSILVRSATAISDLSSLQGVRFAFSSKNSYLSYKAALKMLQREKVAVSSDKILFSYSDVASLTLILHKDVFATAIASPLANKWAEKNGLKVIAQSQAFEVGGVWIKNTVDHKLVENCAKAFIGVFLDKANDSTSGLSAEVKSVRKFFPRWLAGFRSPAE
jgi:ABC-type phosphate/phosphonate transport system substrate-binding protein